MTSHSPSPLSLSLAGALAFLAALLGAAVPAAVQAGAQGLGRAESGARLFRAMLAADTEIERKAEAGILRVLIVHASDGGSASTLGALVEGRDARRTPEAIRGIAVRSETMRVSALQSVGKGPVAGVFIAEPLRREAVSALIRFGSEHRVIVYSPFEGDVESGVAGGLLIEAQVRPFINTEALRASQITLREFFLKVAKAYP